MQEDACVGGLQQQGVVLFGRRTATTSSSIMESRPCLFFYCTHTDGPARSSVFYSQHVRISRPSCRRPQPLATSDGAATVHTLAILALCLDGGSEFFAPDTHAIQTSGLRAALFDRLRLPTPT